MNFLAKHKIVILIAILVGLLYIGPSLVVWKNFRESGDRFISMQHKKNSAELQQYLSRAREIYDGHFPPSEIYGSEPAPTVQNALPSALFASFIFLFNGNINLAYLGALFLFSAIIFILFYCLGQIMFSSRLKSLFFSLVAVLTPIANIAKEFPFFSNFANFQVRFINSFLPFLRTQFNQLPLDRFDEPLLTYPIYLSAIILFIIFWQKPRMITAIFSGFFAGLLFYTYFHHWIYWTIVLGILFLYALAFKRKDRILIKNYLILFGVLAAMFIPYFINYVAFIQMPDSQDFSFKVGTIYGRYLGITGGNIIDYATYILLGALVYFMYWKGAQVSNPASHRHKAVLFFGFILAMFVVWNVQLVTGIAPLTAYFRRPLAPLIFLILFSLLYDLIAKLEIKWPQIRKYAAAIFIVLAIFAVTKNIVNISAIGCCMQAHILEYNKFPNDIIESWDWINDNFEHEPKIISSSPVMSLYLPAYTSARPFLPTAYITFLGMREVDGRYLLSQKLFGVKNDVARDKIDNELDVLYGFYFFGRYGSFSSYFSAADKEIINQKRAEKVDELAGRYEAMVMPQWEDVDAGYVYVGPWEKETAGRDFVKDKDLELVYQNPSVEIYRIIH